MKAPTTTIAVATALVVAIVFATNGFLSELTPDPPSQTMTITTLWAERPTRDSPLADVGTGLANPVSIRGADTRAEIAITTAIKLFTDAGLQLPALTIYVHQSDEGCDGHQGLFGKRGDQQRIDLCQLHGSVIRHELAHAWESHAVDDTTRQAFLDRADLESWNDQLVPHPARGIERAAYLIAWGVAPEPIQLMLRSVHSEDLERYELLTGTPSPRIAHWGAAAASVGVAVVPTEEITIVNIFS